MHGRHISARIHAGTTSLRMEQHFVLPPAVIQAIQLSSLFMTFRHYHANTLEVSVFRALRHATLPVRFPFSDKSGDDRVRIIPLRYFSLLLARSKIITAPYGRTTIVLEIGVPVAKTTPLPLLISLIYSHFKNISIALWLPLPVMPDTFILLNTARFLNMCASSHMMESMPNSSKVIRSSFRSSSLPFRHCPAHASPSLPEVWCSPHRHSRPAVPPRPSGPPPRA